MKESWSQNNFCHEKWRDFVTIGEKYYNNEMTQPFNPNHQESPFITKLGQKVVVFNPKNQILFLKRSEKSTRPGGWDFPGGGLEFGEDPTAGIIRETREETQLTLTNLKPILATSTVNDNGKFVVIIGYSAQTSDTTAVLSWEHDEYQWLSAQEALQVELPEAHRSFLERALAESTID